MRADKDFSFMVHLHKAVKAKKAKRSSPFLPTTYDCRTSCSADWLGLGAGGRGGGGGWGGGGGGAGAAAYSSMK